MSANPGFSKHDQPQDALKESARLTALTRDIAVALVQTHNLQTTLNNCADAIVRHLDAAFARVWTLNKNDNVLELQASAGMYTYLDGSHSRVPVGKYKIGLIAQERKQHLTNSVVGDPRVHDQEWAKREAMVSFAGFPLIVENRVAGVMAMFARHQLSEGVLEAMTSVANAIALGIEHKQAEAALEEQSEVVETINRVGQLLSAELNEQKLVQAVTDAATEITGARFGSFFYNVIDDRGESYMLYTLSGVPREAFAHFPMPRATDLFGPTFRGEGTILISDVKQDSRYGNNSPYYGMPEGHLPVTNYLAVPVISRSSEVIGGLFFGHPDVGVFTTRHGRIVEGLAAQAAVAMDNARLFESAQRARAEEGERYYRFLSEASRVLASSLEYEATLASVARLAVPAFADWCAVDILEEDGTISRLAVEHADPKKVELAHKLQRRYPADPNRPDALREALRSGESKLASEIPDSMLETAARDAEHLKLIRSLGIKSYIIAPLVARGRTLGAISFVSAETGRRYDKGDLNYAEELAQRAAVAVDNARLYDEARRALEVREQALELHRNMEQRLSLLVHASDTLIGSPLLSEVLPAILTISRKLVEADAYEVWRYDSSKKEWRILSAFGLSDGFQQSTIAVAGKLRLEVRPVELASVVKAAVETVRPAAEAKDIRIHTERRL